VEPHISLHVLIGISSTQTLKLIAHVKHSKLIILINIGRTHNFIHYQGTKDRYFYTHELKNFDIMIANRGSTKCGGHCENVFLQIGNYYMKCHIFFIEMGCRDIVLGVEWLCILGPVTMEFKDLY